MTRLLRLALFLAAIFVVGIVHAQTPSAPPPPPPAQGVAVVGLGARDEAFTLARAVYAGRLRPAALDEQRARVLAGDAAPPSASKELRELGELRAAVTGEDAASRKLLASIAQQLGAEALLV